MTPDDRMAAFDTWEREQKRAGIQITPWLAFQKGMEIALATTEKQSRPKVTLEEARKHHADKGYHFDVEMWYGHYQANGWKVGRNPMKDWRAAMVTWERNWREKNQVRSAWKIA